jgi:tRNA A37 threonylcarbamoyltransferase TsaD
LPGSLIVGKAAANLLKSYFNKPLKAIHHIHGHLFSLLLERKKEDLTFPMVVLTAS